MIYKPWMRCRRARILFEESEERDRRHPRDPDVPRPWEAPAPVGGRGP